MKALRLSFPTTSTLLTAAAVATVACSSQDKTANQTAAQAGAPVAAAPNVVTVRARDFAFDAPDSIPSGVTMFKFTNDGPSFHHAQIVRLDSGKTVADLQAALKKPGAPPPMWAVFVGGPNAPDPKSESNGTLNLTPGNYAILCLVDVPDGVPHFAKGMIHGLKVSASTAVASALPTADISVSLNDYAFTLTKDVTPGTHTFEVSNAGTQPHEVEVIKLAPGKTAKEMIDWIMKPQGPPPGDGMGGGAAIVPGATEYFNGTFEPGDYALVCFIPDMKDGKPHFVHGMLKTFHVG